MALAFVGLAMTSCKDGNAEASKAPLDSEMTQEDVNSSTSQTTAEVLNPESEMILADYMALKNALVETDEAAAASAGKKLENTLKSFEVASYTSEQQQALKPILSSAIAHAERISNNGMEQQRADFQKLNDVVTEMVAITGTKQTLYQQFCPMYGDGGAWLSTEKNIRNPYFGSKMMKCGEVQKEIN